MSLEEVFNFPGSNEDDLEVLGAASFCFKKDRFNSTSSIQAKFAILRGRSIGVHFNGIDASHILKRVGVAPHIACGRVLEEVDAQEVTSS